MRRAAAQVSPTFAILAGAAVLLFLLAPVAAASPNHARPTAAAARAHAGHRAQRPPSHRAAARGLIVRATRYAGRPPHPARAHHAASKGRGPAQHAAQRSKAEPQRAAGPVPVASAARGVAAIAPHGAARRIAAPQPSEPES